MVQRVNSHELMAAQAQAEAEERQCVVGAIIVNARGQVFVQKRSANRRLFPNCWDSVGGHVEPGETLEETLRREIREETGWELSRILTQVGLFDWEDEQGGKRREFDYLVQVEGDLEHPQLEWTKNSEFRWIGPDEVDLLRENRSEYDTLLFGVVKRALEEAASL